jgi:hypothetical protein
VRDELRRIELIAGHQPEQRAGGVRVDQRLPSPATARAAYSARRSPGPPLTRPDLGARSPPRHPWPLRERGLIQIVPGRGTFVVAVPPDEA